MDRIISEEERIRRAEDILERRRNTDLRISSENFVKEKSNNKIRKILIQVLISLIIYCGIYYIRNSQNENLKNIMGNINTVLEYDVDFKKIYEEISKKCESLNIKLNSNIQENNAENGVESNDVENSENTENDSSQLEQSGELENNQENNSQQDSAQNELSEETELIGIGGGADEQTIENTTALTEEEQMNVDAEYIRNNFSIIKPLTQYTVTSRFGSRASTEIVSANHKGIDLGAVTGTPIISAMEGTVIEASSEGDYGIHLKIQNGDITLVYAHCSEILVKSGDVVTQGQEIAKVGSTGKATGPHLHFEIRRESRAINPEHILEF